jgi:phosphoribosylformylglycinamidine (FGAM) synthase PurS component
MEAAEAMCRKILANPVTEDFEVAACVEMAGAGR